MVKKKNLFFWLILTFLLPMLVLATEQHNVNCGEDINISFVCNNTTVEHKISCLNNFSCYEYSNITLSLEPGENKLLNESSYYLDASCEACPSNETNVCSVNKFLDSAEHYTKQSGACDLDIRCEECQECEEISNDTTQITFQKNFRLWSDGKLVKFRLDGAEQGFIKNSTFDFETEFKYYCPAELEVNTTEMEVEKIIGICEEVNPYLLNWVDATLEDYRTCKTRLETCIGQKAGLDSSCDDKVNSVDEKLLVSRNQLNMTNQKLYECRDDLVREKGNDGYLVALCIIFGGISALGVFISVLLAYLLWKKKKTEDYVKNRGGDAI